MYDCLNKNWSSFMRILITGGAGFIGSAVIRHGLIDCGLNFTTVDNLTYAGNLNSLITCIRSEKFRFVKANICNPDALNLVFNEFKPEAVMHMAAESHVDRSILSPADFIETNINGTFTLLEQARKYYDKLPKEKQQEFRFHHISTDEVYGDLAETDPPFTEETPYSPSSPYSASKAASDHLVRAWGRTYGLPIIITNCSNNYGPYHFPEKLIPNMILNALQGKQLPIYGDGLQIRDWLYVEDHAKALIRIITKGGVGQTYNIGGHNEKTNLEVVETICELLEELAPDKPNGLAHYRDLIAFVKDRPGHDTRYAIDSSKIERELGWLPEETFESGLRKTVNWYLMNRSWWESILSGAYKLDRLEDLL